MLNVEHFNNHSALNGNEVDNQGNLKLKKKRYFQILMDAEENLIGSSMSTNGGCENCKQNRNAEIGNGPD